MRPSPFISFETRSRGGINSVDKFWVPDVEFVGVDSYDGAIDVMELSDFGPIPTLKNHIVVDLVPERRF